MSAWARASILLMDNAGNIAKVFIIVAAAAIDPGSGAISLVQAALQGLTKAISPRAESGGSAGGVGGEPVAGNYGAVEDRAILTFQAADGSTQLVEVPAPKNGCFFTGTTQVDPDATGIVDIIAWYEGTGKSKYNQALSYVKGIRSRKRQMKV